MRKEPHHDVLGNLQSYQLILHYMLERRARSSWELEV